MSGQPPNNGGGGGWRIPPPQSQPQPQPQPQPQAPYIGFQNPNFVPYPFFPNPNFRFQNPNFVNFPIQQNLNPTFHFQQPPHQQNQFQQPPHQQNQFQQPPPQQSFPRGNNEVAERVDGAAVNVQPNPSFQVQQPPPQNYSNFQFQKPPLKGNKAVSKEVIDRVDKAVTKARKDLIEAGENVSAWKVSQAALVILNADTWDSLGFTMQEVPSLHSLIITEGKINAFIHCFVGVQSIATLYDLEVAICKNEGVEQFEELELGPLVKHPLIIHYFSINLDVSEVFRITSKEIMSFLSKFMDADSSKNVNINEFLDFITEKKSAGTRENLCVRIQSLRYVAYFTRTRFS
ncbi:hypothetical protein HAX54_020360 [Datura stramonium]|uniref:EF-hand domain-containing protein n=1 Tax=Datura stramonium TaxID=4076 RepID=A0ABS8S4N2_DATST|nr:hypothetical protein [Datura stramonium]